MQEELNALYAELEAVRKSTLYFLPEYGYMEKEEVISPILEDIADLEEEIRQSLSGYEDDELEQERRALCLSQGISRWC